MWCMYEVWLINRNLSLYKIFLWRPLPWGWYSYAKNLPNIDSLTFDDIQYFTFRFCLVTTCFVSFLVTLLRCPARLCSLFTCMALACRWVFAKCFFISVSSLLWTFLPNNLPAMGLTMGPAAVNAALTNVWAPNSINSSGRLLLPTFGFLWAATTFWPKAINLLASSVGIGAILSAIFVKAFVTDALATVVSIEWCVGKKNETLKFYILYGKRFESPTNGESNCEIIENKYLTMERRLRIPRPI